MVAQMRGPCAVWGLWGVTPSSLKDALVLRWLCTLEKWHCWQQHDKGVGAYMSLKTQKREAQPGNSKQEGWEQPLQLLLRAGL